MAKKIEISIEDFLAPGISNEEAIQKKIDEVKPQSFRATTQIPRKIRYHTSKKTGVVLQRTRYFTTYKCVWCQDFISVAIELNRVDTKMLCNSCRKLIKNYDSDTRELYLKLTEIDKETLQRKKIRKNRKELKQFFKQNKTQINANISVSKLTDEQKEELKKLI